MLEITFVGYQEYLCLRQALSEYVQNLLGKQTLMHVALHECINNAFEHGSTSLKTKVRVKFRLIAKRRFIVRVEHNGRGLSLANCRTLTDSEDLLNNFSAGNCGCGLYLIHKIADRVHYNRAGTGVLLMKKRS